MSSTRGTRFISLMDAARDAEREGDRERAIARYLAALRIVTPNDAEIEMVMAIQDAPSVIEAPELDRADSHIRSKLVDLYRASGNPKAADFHARVALFLDRGLHGEEHNNTSASHHDLGLVLVSLGRPIEALESFRKSEAIDRLAPVKRSARMEVSLRAFVRREILADYGYVEEAAQYAAESLDEIEELFSDHEKLVAIYDRACQCLQNIGEHALARPYLEKAIRLARLHNVHRKLQMILCSNLSTLLVEQGELDLAEKWLKERNALAAEPLRSDAIVEERRLTSSWRRRYSTGRQAGEVRHDFFISYSTSQEALSERLRMELESRGLSVWTFKQADDWESQRPNEDVFRETRAQIDRSELLLAIGTGTSLTSRFVMDEIEYASSKGMPVLMWYPEGTRQTPKVSSTWGTENLEQLRSMTYRLLRPGVSSYYGYGLRNREVGVIADAIVKRLAMIYPEHEVVAELARAEHVVTALDATRMWPVLLDSDQNPLFKELTTAAMKPGNSIGGEASISW